MGVRNKNGRREKREREREEIAKNLSIIGWCVHHMLNILPNECECDFWISDTITLLQFYYLQTLQNAIDTVPNSIFDTNNKHTVFNASFRFH